MGVETKRAEGDAQPALGGVLRREAAVVGFELLGEGLGWLGAAGAGVCVFGVGVGGGWLGGEDSEG